MTESAVTLSDPRPVAIGTRICWLFADGTTLPFVRGGADDDITPDLSALSDEELASALDAAINAFDDEFDAGDVPRLTALTEEITAARAEQERRSQERAEQAEQAQALRNLVHPAEQADEDEDEQVEPSPAPEPEEEAEPVEEPEPVHAERQSVAAAAVTPRPSAAATASRAPRAPAPKPAGPRVTLTAAGDVPGHSVGTNMAVSDLGAAFTAKAGMLGDSRGAGTRYPVARIEVPYPENRTIRQAGYSDEVDSAINAALAPKESLVAGGGWGTPSEFLFNLFNIATAQDLFQLPSVRIMRGGIQIPVSPSYADISYTGFTWTEQNDIDATTAGAPDPTKTVVRIPGTTWNEMRLGADGVIIVSGNLQDRAFSEMTRQFIDLTMAAHEHVISAKKLAAVAALCTDKGTVGPMPGMTTTVLGQLEALCSRMRTKYRTGDNAIMELVLPTWARGVIRADLVGRDAAEWEMMSVSDEQINAWFRERRMAPQFCVDWQPQTTDTWPTSMQPLMYPAGTFIEGDGGTIDLGVIRDSVLAAVNDFTAAWSESFWAVGKRGHEGFKCTIPTVPDGRTSIAVVSPDAVSSITVTPATLALTAAGADSSPLVATATAANGDRFVLTNAQVTWTSSVPAKATVNAAGVVHPLTAGTTNVTCTFGGITSSACAVTVS